jgi:predicted methyltransferase MtxX (methanogen marker protein 4)
VISGDASRVLEPLAAALDDATVNLGVATLLPRVAVVCGSRLVDLSDARRPQDILSEAEAVLAHQDGVAVAVIWQ